MPSSIYDQNIYAPVRQTIAEISYSLVAPEAKELATVITPTGNAFSRSEQIIDNVTNISTRIATFEPDYWRLDGSFVLPLHPETSNMQVGFWGNILSNSDGIFETIPQITVTFSQVQNIRRFGVAFDEPSDNFCTDLEFTAYDSSLNIIYNERITDNNSAYAYTAAGALNIYRIIIKFYKTNNPYRYLRIGELDFGIVIRFNDMDITNLSLIIEGDHTGRTFPFSQLTLNIHNRGRFNILDPESYAQYLYARQPFEYRHGLVLPDSSIEWVYCGVYYLQNKDISDNAVNFTCVGKSSIANDFTFFKSSFQEITLGRFIENILNELRFDSYIDPILYNSPVITAYTGNVSFRDVFALLSEVSSCLAFENQENTIVFKDILINGVATDIIDYNNALSVTTIKQEQYYNGINLTEYSMSLEQGQLSQTSIAVSGSTNISIYFDSPQKGTPTYTITSGFTLSSIIWHTMYMTATLTGNGTATITITGQRVTFANSEVFYPAPWHDPLEADYPYSINLPMMIRTTAFPTFRTWFLNRKFALLQKRLSTEINWRGNPALQIGNIANIQINNKGDNLDMITTRHTITYNGGALSSKTKLIGDNP